jgi:dTDP-4-dehydrorhamnose 3,5-epimerase/reductase
MDGKHMVIVGAGGQLGRALAARFPNAVAVDREELDITDLAAVKGFDWSGVDVVLNAAAYTNVDGAETPEGRVLAWKINATAAGYLARMAVEHDLVLVHVSTDYVFDGTRNNHPEDEDLAPLGVYAQAKAAGDVAVGVAPKHYILRTSSVVGDGHNFVRIMLGLAEKNISPSVVDDQIVRLTFTATLVDAAEHLLKTKAQYGVYNVTNDGEPAAWADVTRAIFKETGRDDLKVKNVSTAEYFKSKPNVAPRPHYSALDLGKIKAAGLKLRDWRDDLRDYIKHETGKE